MYTWQVLFTDTGEIAEKRGYQYPHTAQAGSTRYLQSCLRDRLSNASDTVMVYVIDERTGKPVRDSGKVTIGALV